MQVVILCGGMGTRLREQTEFMPKPMISIGGRPLVWHIMKHYSNYGLKDFILALGYRQEVFKNYFGNVLWNTHDITVGTVNESPVVRIKMMPRDEFAWRIALIDTGLNTLKGGRLLRVKAYIHDDDFCVTYGDAVSDVNIQDVINFHKFHGKILTIVGVHPSPRFGELYLDGDQVVSYSEKPVQQSWINGGFMVMKREIFDFLPHNQCDLEKGPFERLASAGQMMVYKHEGFWKCMDTLRDMGELQQMWEEKDNGEVV